MFASVQADSAASNKLLFELANYLNYSEQNQAHAQSQGTTVLFFAATRWCQTCSLLEEEIIHNTKLIPQKTTILKVDYDQDLTRNKQFGVTSQHTLIVLDKNGTELKRWVGGDFNHLLKELKTIEEK